MSNMIGVYDNLNQILSFGKYKGKSVSVLMQDKNYCNWLINQEWFRQKHSDLYGTIMNNVINPIFYSERNEMLTRFLDDQFVRRFRVISGLCKESGEKIYREYTTFGEYGWDVCCEVWFTYYHSYREGNCIGQRYVKLVPELGNNFLGILQQMNSSLCKNLDGNMISPDKCCLVYKKYTGYGATEKQMRQMFERSEYIVLKWDEIDDPVDLEIDPLDAVTTIFDYGDDETEQAD